MEKYLYQKALASDLDETLIFYDLPNTFKKADLVAIAHFQKQGYLFGACTGRPLCGLHDLESLKLDFYIVSSGAILLDQNYQILEDYPLDKKLAKNLFEKYQQQVEIIVQTDSLTTLYATFKEGMSENVEIIKSFAEIKANKIYGISFIVETEEIARKINEELAKDFPQLSGFQNKNSIDIVKKGCSKGIAAKKIKQYLKIKTMAGIGDSFNDLPLIKASDIGFTFNRSPEVLQKEANYLVDNLFQAIEILEDCHA